MRIEDDKVCDKYRGLQFCELCRKRVMATECSHTEAKGMGGGKCLDIDENCTAACRICHQVYHNGGYIKRHHLVKATAVRLKLTPDQIEAIIKAGLRAKSRPEFDELRAVILRGEPMDATPSLAAVAKDLLPEVSGHPAHQIAMAFPRPTLEEMDALEADILADGLQKPIWLWNGQVIDGLSRQALCLKHGIECRTEDWSHLSEEDAIQKAYAENVGIRPRRILSSSQRAMVAAKLAKLLPTINKAGRPTQKPDEPPKNTENTDENNRAPNGARLPDESKSEQPAAQKKARKRSSRAAKEQEASGRNVDRATRILDQCIPEIIEAVDAKLAKVGDAEKIATETHDVQRAALELVKSGQCKTLVKAVAKLKEPKPTPESAWEWDWRGRLIFDKDCLEKHKAGIALKKRGDDLAAALRGIPTWENVLIGGTGQGEYARVSNGIKAWQTQHHPGIVCPLCYGTGEYSEERRAYIDETVQMIHNDEAEFAKDRLSSLPTGEKCPSCEGKKWYRWAQCAEGKVDDAAIFAKHAPHVTDVRKDGSKPTCNSTNSSPASPSVTGDPGV